MQTRILTYMHIYQSAWHGGARAYMHTWRNRMKTIAVLSRKGGTGKTTLAIHLSVAAEQAGHTTALIDLDPQASATSWRDIRENKTPAVISAHASRLSQILHLAKENGQPLQLLTRLHTQNLQRWTLRPKLSLH